MPAMFFKVLNFVARWGARAVTWVWNNSGKILDWIGRGLSLDWIIKQVKKFLGIK